MSAQEATEQLKRLKEAEERVSANLDSVTRRLMRKLNAALERTRAQGRENGPGIEDEFEHSLRKEDE